MALPCHRQRMPQRELGIGHSARAHNQAEIVPNSADAPPRSKCNSTSISGLRRPERYEAVGAYLRKEGCATRKNKTSAPPRHVVLSAGRGRLWASGPRLSKSSHSQAALQQGFCPTYPWHNLRRSGKARTKLVAQASELHSILLFGLWFRRWVVFVFGSIEPISGRPPKSNPALGLELETSTATEVGCNLNITSLARVRPTHKRCDTTAATEQSTLRCKWPPTPMP